MNDSDLEDQLRALTPAAPSADLARRIQEQLAATSSLAVTSGTIARPSRSPLWWSWLRDLGWATAGATATLVGIFVFQMGNEPPSVSPTHPAASIPQPATVAEHAFKPEASSRELIAVSGSSELLDTEEGPVRQVRYTYREKLGWTRPDTGARLEVEVPREDIYLLPVSLQ